MIGSKFYQRKLTNGITKLYSVTNFTYLEGTWYPKNPEKSYIRIHPIIGAYKDFDLPGDCFYHPDIYMNASVSAMPWCKTFETFKDLFIRYPDLLTTIHITTSETSACNTDTIHTHFRTSMDECTVNLWYNDEFYTVIITYANLVSECQMARYEYILPDDNYKLTRIPENIFKFGKKYLYDPDVSYMLTNIPVN